MGEKKPRPEAIKLKGSTSIHQIYFLEVGEYSRKQSLLLCSSPAFVPIYLLRACASKKTRKFWACPCMTILTCPLEIITQTGTFRPPHTYWEVKGKPTIEVWTYIKWHITLWKKNSPLPKRRRGVGVPWTYLIKYFSYFMYDIICSMPTGRREHVTTSHHICSLNKVSNLIPFVGLSVTILIPLAPNTSFTRRRCTVNPKWKWE